MRVLHGLPKTSGWKRHLELLERLSESSATVPTLVEMYDQGRQVVVVTKWIWGKPLCQVLQQIVRGKRRAFSSFEAVRLFRKFAHGLCQLHFRKRLGHGDIKPSNMILNPDPHQLVLIDYGNSWFHARTSEHVPEVSPAYSAPEVLDGVAPDFRSDQFSAAVVFYELLTQEIPYNGLGGQVGFAHQAGESVELLRPSEQLSDPGTPRTLWQQIDRVIARGLQVRPQERYPGQRAWLDDLDSLYRRFHQPSELSSLSRWLLRLTQGWGRS